MNIVLEIFMLFSSNFTLCLKMENNSVFIFILSESLKKLNEFDPPKWK